MSVYKPKHSKNYIAVFKHKGRWFRKSAQTPNLSDAKKVEEEYRKQFIDEQKGLRQSISVGRALDMFKESKEGTANYKNLGRHNEILKTALLSSTPLHEVSTRDISRFVAKQRKNKASNATIKHRLQALRSAINLADDNGFLVPDLRYPKHFDPKATDALDSLTIRGRRISASGDFGLEEGDSSADVDINLVVSVPDRDITSCPNNRVATGVVGHFRRGSAQTTIVGLQLICNPIIKVYE